MIGHIVQADLCFAEELGDTINACIASCQCHFSCEFLNFLPLKTTGHRNHVSPWLQKSYHETASRCYVVSSILMTTSKMLRALILPLFDMLRRQCLKTSSTVLSSIQWMKSWFLTKAPEQDICISSSPRKKNTSFQLQDLQLSQYLRNHPWPPTLPRRLHILQCHSKWEKQKPLVGAKVVPTLWKTIPEPRLSVVFCNFFASYSLLRDLTWIHRHSSWKPHCWSHLAGGQAAAQALGQGCQSERWCAMSSCDSNLQWAHGCHWFVRYASLSLQDSLQNQKRGTGKRSLDTPLTCLNQTCGWCSRETVACWKRSQCRWKSSVSKML